MSKQMFIAVLVFTLVCSACGGNDSDSDSQVQNTPVPTAIVQTLPPNEPLPTENTEAVPIGEEPQVSEATPTLEITFPTVYQDQYPANVNAGQTLVVNYIVTLNNPGVGRIFILVRDPANAEVARLVVTQTTTDALEVGVNTSGIHTILVAYENLDGNYSVTYEVR